MKFEDLNVWKKAARLAAEIYKHTAGLKDWGFRDQITRAALSVSSNIAEGSERRTSKELLVFLRYANGSCGELRSQLYIGIEVGYIEPEFGKRCLAETRDISAMLHGLSQSIKSKLKK